MKFWKNIFNRCKHDWFVHEKVDTTSPLVRMMENGLIESCKGFSDRHFSPTFIIIMSCKKCGKLKKIECE